LKTMRFKKVMGNGKTMKRVIGDLRNICIRANEGNYGSGVTC
jgi:hypothetical protein